MDGKKVRPQAEIDELREILKVVMEHDEDVDFVTFAKAMKEVMDWMGGKDNSVNLMIAKCRPQLVIIRETEEKNN